MRKNNIDHKSNQLLTQIFSNRIISNLINSNKLGFKCELERILSVSGFIKFVDNKTTFNTLFDIVYAHLLKFYRSEYIYKNTIANKILLGRHSLNTASMLLELRTANCKADVIVINGTSNVYEIKTELDSLDRLKKQIKAYEQVFDLIHIISGPLHIDKLKNLIESHIGLLVLTPQNTIRLIRKAKSNKQRVLPLVIFDSLRKYEYCAIINEKFGYIPSVPNTKIYRECKKLFLQLKPEEAHDLMVKELLKRGSSLSLKKFINSTPYSLKAFALNSRLKKADESQFIEILNKKCEIFY